MRWFQFQLRKPKRWARRAKSDGSAVPKLKRVIAHRKSAWFKYTLILSIGIWLIGIVIPVLLLNVFMLIDEYNLLFMIGFSPSINQTIIFTRSILYGMVLLMVAMNANVYIQIWLKRREAKKAIAHRCHLCPRCGYSLQSRTDDTHPCPECGQHISRREAVRLWARFCR